MWKIQKISPLVNEEIRKRSLQSLGLDMISCLKNVLIVAVLVFVTNELVKCNWHGFFYPQVSKAYNICIVLPPALQSLQEPTTQFPVT